MPSVLDNSIVDSLLGVVDDVRSSVHSFAGDRQHVVKLVRRTWSGKERYQGEDHLEEIVLSPPPRVMFENLQSRSYTLRPEGRQEDGVVKVTEISLAAYQEDDLTGGDIPPNVEFYWALEDAHGQGLRRREYVLFGPPIADREKDIGWTVYLKRAEAV
jgi:hypothetical protein